MTNLTQAHHEWATRPTDQRFWDLDEMYLATLRSANCATEVSIPTHDLRIYALDDGDLAVALPDERRARLGHYAFGQVCSTFGAPAGYMRQLPSYLAKDCLMHSSGRQDRTDRLLLVDESRIERPRLRAMTSTRYTRVWNHLIVDALRNLQDEGWVVPPARPTNQPGERTRIATEADVVDFGDSPLSVQVGDEIAPAGLYASDHDMFAFLIHPDRVVENGLSPAGMRRGTMIRQSEVGASSIWKLDFLFDTVCGNHIVWGAQQVQRTSVRHMGSTNSVDAAWAAMIEDIAEGADAGAAQQEADIRRAQQVILGNGRDEIVELLFKKRWTTRKVADAAYTSAVAHEEQHGDPNSLWGMVSGITRISQQHGFADQRAHLDRDAGKMLAACLA